MPSGPKKRKAAKKKKENQHNNHTGDDDLNQQAEVLGSSSVQGIVGHKNLSAEWEKEEIDKVTDISNPGGSENSVVRIDREFEIGEKPEEDGEQERRFEGDESVSKSSNESSSDSCGGSGSNSDDESRDNGNSQVTVDISPEAESVKALYYLSGRSDENELSVSGHAVEENSAPVDLVEISQSCEEAEKHANSPANSSLSSFAAESVFKESEEINPSSVEDKVDTPSKVTSKSVENIATTSDTKEWTVEENDGPTKEVEHQRKSRVTEPLLSPAPIPVQTSWKSCCGLFELFAGSGRQF